MNKKPIVFLLPFCNITKLLNMTLKSNNAVNNKGEQVFSSMKRENSQDMYSTYK
jgi:hypothetical protein